MKRKMLLKIVEKKKIGVKDFNKVLQKIFYKYVRNLMLFCFFVIYKFMDRMLKVRMFQL